MSKLIVLVGLPASGKSAIAEELKVEHNAILLSSDALREELLGDVNNQDKNTDIFVELYKRANKYLNGGENVILDATNINRKRRIHLINNEIKAEEYHAYYMNTPVGMCLYNDSNRERKVGFEVIDRMYKNMHIPTLLEGWNSVKYVNGECETESFYKDMFQILLSQDDHDYLFEQLSKIIPEFEEIIDVPHDSSYHSFSISRHIYHVHQYVLNNYKGKRPLEMRTAALFHDIGKWYCKSFHNYKGDLKRFASFIGHENTSAQTACVVLHRLGYSDEFIKYVVDLIQFHMLPMNMSVKTEKRLRQLLTKEAYDDLMFLHEADLSAK